MCYACFSYSHSVPFRIFLAIFLTALAVFITLYYHYLQDPVFHQNAYALLTSLVILRSMYIMETTLRPKWRHSLEEDRLHREKEGLPVPSKERQEYENVRDIKTLKTMWFMVVFGITVFLGGFLIWNLDNHFCPNIRRWRKVIGLPWGLFLEGHGWWYELNIRPLFFVVLFICWLYFSRQGILWPEWVHICTLSGVSGFVTVWTSGKMSINCGGHISGTFLISCALTNRPRTDFLRRRHEQQVAIVGFGLFFFFFFFFGRISYRRLRIQAIRLVSFRNFP